MGSRRFGIAERRRPPETKGSVRTTTASDQAHGRDDRAGVDGERHGRSPMPRRPRRPTILAQAILRRFARLRGVDLVVPEREPVREPPVPERSS